jgi:hypothetical protein
VVVVALTLETLDLFDRHSWDDVLEEAWFAVAAVWAVYGALALRVGFRGRPHLRGLGLALVVSAILLGFGFLGLAGRAPRLFWNTRALGFGATALSLLLSAELYRRRAAPPAPLRFGGFVEGPAFGVVFALSGHGLVMLLLTLEAADHFRRAAAPGSEWIDPASARQLAYSLIWAIYAVGMVVGGLLRKYRPVRLMALAVLAGTIAKVFVRDLSFLENPYRILSFLVLGAILVAVSFLYQKYREVLA